MTQRGDHVEGLMEYNPYANPSPRAPLEAACDGIGSALDELGCVVEALEKRLSMLLQPEPPQPGTVADTGVGPADIVASPTVGYLRNMRRRIDRMQAQLIGVMHRLDT